MFEDIEGCLRAVRSKDGRFDGWFVVAVTSTGIYCRPSCPAMTPKPAHMRFLPTAAAAQAAGFRACKRCRPDASPGSPEWNHRADLVARAMRLIADGTVDREGVPGLAGRLGYSVRQVERQLLAELGAGPLALARAQRAQTARVLIETTDLPLTDVALAAGFASVRQFNDTVRAVFADTPSGLRARRRGQLGGPPPPLLVRLPFRQPLSPANLFGHLAATAVPGVEEWRAGAYRRTLRLPHGPGIAQLRPPEPGTGHIECRLWVADLRDVATAIARCRRLLDLDADPVAVDEALGADPALAPLVSAAPGRRVPCTVDGAELAIRAVLGQQVSIPAARTLAARLVLAHGEPVSDPAGGLTHLFPTAAALAELDPATLAMPGQRRRALAALVTALVEGTITLDPGSELPAEREALGWLPGFGPWTVDTIAMRALGDPDVLLAGDLGVRLGAARLGLTRASLATAGQRWRPWRSYAVQHLWATTDHPINRLPAQPGTAPEHEERSA